MKKIYLLFIGLVIIFSSCEDFLNMPPKNVKVIHTIEDVEGAMATFLYATINSSSSPGYISKPIRYNGLYIQNPFHRYTTVFTDLYTNDIDLRYFYNPDIPSNDQATSGKSFLSWYTENKKWEGYRFSTTIWSDVYACVGFLNSILHDLSKVKSSDKGKFERISGEARAIRAYYLFRLNQLFAPYDREDLGIPVTFDAEEIGTVPRMNQKKLYQLLIAEIEDVMAFTTPPKATWNLYYNKDIMNAILANIYMFKAESCAGEEGDWAKAELHAKAARGGRQIESSIEEQKELCELSTSLIFERAHPFTLFRFTIQYASSYSSAPWGVGEVYHQSPTEELYSLYDKDDIRLPVYFKTIAGKERVYIEKNHRASGSVYNSMHNFFRTADLFLIEAEAKARQSGKNEEALQMLNEFKRTKIPGFTGYNGNAVLDEILKERRKELFLEDQKNWLDMKRNRVSVTREAINEETLEIESFTLEADDYRYALPIPADIELMYNKIPQNPGWK